MKTVVWVVGTWPRYVPPDFRSDFLLGRDGYFYGAYAWAFYPHVVAGPLTLVLGLFLMSDACRTRWPAVHRRLGKLQVFVVLFVLAPSGLWMAFYAKTGAVAGAGLATLALATAVTAAMGWRTAVQRQFTEHRVWMQRCYALLCSAVVIRVVGGWADYAGVDGTYAAAAWLSWLAPLSLLEWWRSDGGLLFDRFAARDRQHRLQLFRVNIAGQRSRVPVEEDG